MNNLLQIALRDAPTYLAVVDAELACCELSAGWRDLLGLGRDAAVNIPVGNLFDAVDQGRVVARLRACAMDGRAVRGLAATLTTAARPMPARLWCWQARDPDSNEVRTIVAAYDAVRTGQFVGDSTRVHSLHKQVLEAAAEGVIAVDELGRATYANPAAVTLLGAQIEDIVGHPLHDVLHPVDASGEAYSRDADPVRRACKEGLSTTGDNQHFHRTDGTTVAVRYSAAPIRNKERLTGATLVFADCSEEQARETARLNAEAEVAELRSQLELEREFLRSQRDSHTSIRDRIVATSRRSRRTLDQLRAVARTTANVLLVGETGTGKETLAAFVHEASALADRPLVKVACACASEDEVEAELFGQIRDAGAPQAERLIGRVELARGGTLLLDEVGELSLSAQHRLLRLLEDLDPLLEAPGAHTGRLPADPSQRSLRVLATTSRTLERDAANGMFLDALYDRLAVFPVTIAPLRERAEDIEPLANAFLARVCRELGREPISLNQQQARQLQTQHWTGNMRELHNVIEHAAILSKVGELKLELALPGLARQRHDAARPEPAGADGIRTEEEFRELERANMVAALRQCGGRVSGPDGAAQLLGLKPSTLTYRIKNFDIERHEIVPTPMRLRVLS
ncbi:MAG: sigma 54-interacting transcriptional regulator [Pseudomonadota bacterium]